MTATISLPRTIDFVANWKNLGLAKLFLLGLAARTSRWLTELVVSYIIIRIQRMEGERLIHVTSDLSLNMMGLSVARTPTLPTIPEETDEEIQIENENEKENEDESMN